MTGQDGTGALLHATVHASSNTVNDTEQSYITMSCATMLFHHSDRYQASLVVDSVSLKQKTEQVYHHSNVDKKVMVYQKFTVCSQSL